MREEAESTDRRILEIATEHVRRFGIRRTTVVGIAEAAGMTHANVYRYFPSKQALADRVAGDWLRIAESRLSDIAQAPDPADDKLERFVTYLARAYEEKLARDPNIFAAFIDALAARRAIALRHRERVNELLGRIIEEGIATRVLPNADPGRISRLVLDVLHRFIDPQAIFGARGPESPRGAGTIDERRDRAARILIRGLTSGRGF
jgi:AcrR family transcriptional regulator